MSSGPRSVTSNTTSEPPAFLVGPLTTAANAAQSQFMGQTVAQPNAPPTMGGGVPAMVGGGTTTTSGGGGISGLVGNVINQGNTPTTTGMPSPTDPNNLIGGSQSLIGNTLRGDFLSPDTNPFLQQTFNRAADLTRGRLDTEFAGAGRNLGAAQPARSQELQTLAADIFGGNFQRERDRQIGAIDQSQALDPLNLFINRLAGIIPGAGGSTQSTQPVFRTGLF